MSHEYFNPVRSVYGAGALSSLPELLAGRRAVLVTFPEARALGLVARIEQLLGDQLVCVIDDVRPFLPGASFLSWAGLFAAPTFAQPVIVGIGCSLVYGAIFLELNSRASPDTTYYSPDRLYCDKKHVRRQWFRQCTPAFSHPRQHRLRFAFRPRGVLLKQSIKFTEFRLDHTRLNQFIHNYFLRL